MEFKDVQKKSSRYPLSVKLRVSHEDMEAIKTRAAAHGETVSSYLRKKAVGSKMPTHIQDLKDIGQLRQHFGLLKHLIVHSPSSKSDLEPLLDSISNLVSSMREKANL